MPSKKLFGTFLSIFLLVAATGSWGAMPVTAKGTVGAKPESARKVQDRKTAPAPVNSVKKTTEFVKMIDAGFLYTEGGRYSLSGVKVTDFTSKRKTADLKSLPKRTAEMTFINQQLREVVIRQRQ